MVTVNSAFNDFIRDYVDLDGKITTSGRNSRDWLYDQLKTFPDKVENFPILYKDKEVMSFGSFRRRTKIRPLDDIDLMLVFSGDGTTYFENNGTITLNVPDSAELLKKLTNDDGVLNSIRVIEKIKSSLSIIPQYQKAEIHRRQEAATLDLSSYDWVFDIVPAFITTRDGNNKDYYIIPDGAGNWKKTDPRLDNDRATNINQRFNGNILGFIRLIKYWNTNCSIKISSYLIENIVIDYFENRFWWNGRTQELRDFFNDLSTSIFNSHLDPKGIQGDLNTLDWDSRQKVSSQANECVQNINNAIYYENQGYSNEALECWRNVFGSNF